MISNYNFLIALNMISNYNFELIAPPLLAITGSLRHLVLKPRIKAPIVALDSFHRLIVSYGCHIATLTDCAKIRYDQ